MNTIHILPHTHWDREWYQPFQEFRLRLVHTIDTLLDILAAEPEYRNFMLDGQTITLEDYLAVRPERAADLQAAVQAGRISIGPWYILPDEFLVSPEATIRNLLRGERVTRAFGSRMDIGYLPDPFGHIGQMPQILNGFGISAAVLRRGLDVQPCELFWESPDGSRVLLAYLPFGYGNAFHLPAGLPEQFAEAVRVAADQIRDRAQTGQLLLMYGTDHTEPAPGTSRAIACTQERLTDRVLHSSLPEYVQAMAQEVAERGLNLPVVRGELRSPKRHDLLPGVLSARMHVKQRNHDCENLLERWAEPTSALAEWLGCDGRNGTLKKPSEVVRAAWKLLLECHPHDTICGCSVDPVYEEVKVRQDAIEQMGNMLVAQNLSAIAGETDTRPPEGVTAGAALVVFNPSPFPQTGPVEADFRLPVGMGAFELVDETGRAVPAEIDLQGGGELEVQELDREALREQWVQLTLGRIGGLSIIDAAVRRQGSTVEVDFTVSPFHEPEQEAVETLLGGLADTLSGEGLTYRLRGRKLATAHVRWLARDLPALGFRTYWLRPVSSLPAEARPAAGKDLVIENEFLQALLAEDGTLALLDKRTGQVYEGLNRFVDTGDRGDSYNYCPVEQDEVVTARLVSARREENVAESALVAELEMSVPAGLSEDRRSRSAERLTLRLTTRARLLSGVPRLDIETVVHNPARDHRLRVHFPAPFAADSALHDGHFEVVERPLGIPPYEDDWAEFPRPEVPQRLFTSIAADGAGLMIANRGLPEVEVARREDGGTEIALTLLRCTGWLARRDLWNRKSLAGPPYPLETAQMTGAWRFEYAVLPHQGDWLEPAPAAYAFDLPPRAALTGLHGGQLPATGAFFSIEPAGWIVTALKTAEDSPRVVLRGYNATGQSLDLQVQTALPFRQAALLRLDETEVEPLEGSPLRLAVKPRQIVTLGFSPAAD